MTVSLYRFRLLILTTLLVGIIFSSCSIQQFTVKDETTEVVHIPYSPLDFKIVDARINKKPMNWKVPLIGIRKYIVEGHPELSPADSVELLSLIKRAESPNSIPAHFTLVINEGSCGINGDALKVTEVTRVNLNLIVATDDGKKSTASYEGSYEVQTPNATEKSTVKSYQATFKNVFHRALKELAKVQYPDVNK